MKVINLYKATKEEIAESGVIYIGRNAQFYMDKYGVTKSLEILSNPYKVGVDGARGECVQLYKNWLWLQIKTKNMYVTQALLSLKEDAVLACFCSPKACHGEVIIAASKYVKELSKNQT